ncbi:WD40 repeat domain-containing serine/threonine protein kinase [Nonomuraea composti]|uniref:WD40 repeat domain-containing serine/threonine protein kinase n=1 Tax=Nonomuraea composti TaxID=2720023 RepID=UPI001980DB92|nr:WD40 repeat domain-containing serine/threonine protein kinase [Nonomuraea sp. FMUSA5-5]
MASFAPLRPGDPQRLGGLELLGRLGEGGQGVVYLAKDHAGQHVAVKWLRPDLSGDQVSVERFLREVQVAQRVAPFCTAAVLGTGVEQDRPYIVSEFIEGPSLQRVVQEEGPRAGSVLHRLAIGTATALAAIHQAGIVHRDFKPANVIIGADGPRVIDFGIARALNATSTISSMVVGTPSYMPPEQIMGHTVGPAADMFSWASAMVFAASGRAPFGSDTMPAVINRVLNQQPDLSALGEGPLRDVVVACLSKDPAQRPTAEQVIMRLLHQPAPNPGMLAQGAAEAAPAQRPYPHPAGPPSGPHGGPSSGPPFASPSAPMHTPMQGPMSGNVPYATGAPFPQPQQQAAWQQPTIPPYAQGPYTQTRPRKSGRAPLIAGVTVAVALLLLAGVIVVIQLDKAATTVAVDTGTPEPQRSRTSKTAQASVPATGNRRSIPGGKIYLYENPADAIVLTSYEVFDKPKDDWIDYARNSLRGTFTKLSGNWESMVSPDGRLLATRGRSYSSDDYDFIVISDRTSGERTTIKTVKEPLISSIRSWSKDGSKILLNVEKKSGSKWLYTGFVLVDVAAKTAEVVDVDDTSVRETAFGFDGDDEGVVNVYGDEKNRSLRFFDSEGKATRSLTGIGTLSAGTQDIFSPSGKTFFTNCPNGGDGDHCIWDTATGKQVRKFSSDCDKALGFYDESHLYCWEQNNGDNDEIQVLDFNGKLLRKMLEVPDDLNFSPVFTINPAKGS